MKVLVTGAAGYVGSFVCFKLKQQGYTVEGIDNFSSGYPQACFTTVHYLDITNSNLLDDYFSIGNFDAVIHLASLSEVRKGDAMKDQYRNVVLLGTINILRCMVKYGVKFLVFSSSCSVYGDGRVVSEETAPNPINEYGKLKLRAEKLIESSGINYLILRLFNICGADLKRCIGDLKRSRLIPGLLQSAFEVKERGENVLDYTVYGVDFATKDGFAHRDFVHVSDVGTIIQTGLRKLEDRSINSRIVNVSGSMVMSVKDIVGIVEKITEININLKNSHSNGEFHFMEPAYITANIERAKEELNFSPRMTDMEQIIFDAWEFTKMHPHGYGRSCSWAFKCMYWRPGMPIQPQLYESPMVLIIRHAKRTGSVMFPDEDDITYEGKRDSYLLGKELSNVAVAAVLHSNSKRCYLTAKAIRDHNFKSPPLHMTQILGYSGPQISDVRKSEEKFEQAVEARNYDYLIDLANGVHIDGFYDRKTAIRRIYNELSIHSRRNCLTIAISHDSIIAAVAGVLNLTTMPWVDELQGILVDLEVLNEAAGGNNGNPSNAISNHQVSSEKLILSQKKPRFSDLSLKYNFKMAKRSAYEDLKMKNVAIANRYLKYSVETGRPPKDVYLPIYATIQTNDGCNLHCGMCQIHRPHLKPMNMDRELFEEIVTQIFPHLIEVHPSNIGEPLLWPYFEILLDRCADYGVTLDLTTNGTLLNEELCKKIVNVAGDVKISIDGATAATYGSIRKNGNFETVLRNVRMLSSLGSSESAFSVTLQMTLMRSNYTELVDMVRLASELGCKRLKAYHIFCFHENDRESVLLEPIPDDFDEIVKKAKKEGERLGISTEIAEKMTDGNIRTDLETSVCHIPFSETFIDTDGTIRLCHSHEGRSLGTISHFGPHFVEIWNSELGAIRQGLSQGVVADPCNKCGNTRTRQGVDTPVEYDIENFVRTPHSINSNDEVSRKYRWSGRMKQYDLVGTCHVRGDLASYDGIPLRSLPSLDLSRKMDGTRATFAFYGLGDDIHDSSVVVMKNGMVIEMLELERLTRIKHDSNLGQYIDDILDTLGIELNEVDIVSVNYLDSKAIASSSGRIKFEIGKDILSDIANISLRNEATTFKSDGGAVSSYVVSHELAHVFSCFAFYEFPRMDSLLIHFDGAATFGNFSAWYYNFNANRVYCLEANWNLSTLSKHFNDNGLAFAIIGANRDEHLSVPGKLMGLAPYGDFNEEIYAWLKENNFFMQCWSMTERNEFLRNASGRFNWKPNENCPFSAKDKFLQDIIACLQMDFVEGLKNKLKSLKRIAGCSELYYSGGCALNILANAELEKLFDNVYIPPCCSDSGLALGAACLFEFLKHGKVVKHGPYLLNYGLGREIDQEDSIDIELVESVGKLLKNGEIIGMCRGNGESGPRSLGNRSILAIPSRDLRDTISMTMKGREWYRPLAPVMTEFCAKKITGMDKIPPAARFMLTNMKILPEYWDKVGGIVHVDHSSRIQVCYEDENPFLHRLLKIMDEKYGMPCLINTSFNYRGEAIAHTHDHAINSARRMGIKFVCFDDKIQRVRPKLSILFVNHGYPPLFNAGSEIYTQNLAHEFHRKGHSVAVLARSENPFLPDYVVTQTEDSVVRDIRLYHINHARSNARIQNDEIDEAFRELLQELRPNIVHFGHLNHLSVGMVAVAKEIQNLKVVFTLHDFWLACPRGQFLHWGLSSLEPFSLCDGVVSTTKCRTKCFNRYRTGCRGDEILDLEDQYWDRWLEIRRDACTNACREVDLFISPSEQLYSRMVDNIPLLSGKTLISDYGFNVSYLPRRDISFRTFPNENRVCFGYIGRHHPSKGIDLLIKSFSRLNERCTLRIWGRDDGSLTSTLKSNSNCENDIEWLNEYDNRNVFKDVFLKCDVIVVPSIWYENSPLVIHECLQSRIPIITADMGGMSEFVKDGVNGNLFSFRNESSLAQVMERVAKNLADAINLAQRGYLQNTGGDIVTIADDASTIENAYFCLLNNHPLSPWRITFDTNVDTCNLHCIMCERFSVYNNEKRCKPRKHMPIEIISDVVRKFSSLGLREVIPSTMGEPLLYDKFDEFISICRKHHMKLNLTTNGTWPKKSVEEWAELLLPIASDIKISWNGSYKDLQESIMKGSKWEKRVADLNKLMEIRKKMDKKPSITLQLTFMQKNLHDIPNIIEFAIRNGFNRVKGHHLWVFYDEMREQDLRRCDESRNEWNLMVRKCHELFNGKIRLDNFVELAMESREGEGEKVCPFLAKEAWVDPEGYFGPCCAPDELRKDLGLHERVDGPDDLLNLWMGDKYRDLVSNYLQKDTCKNCLLRICKSSQQQNPSSGVELEDLPCMSDVVISNWSRAKPSKCFTHHIDEISGKPLYPHRFIDVQSFHSPGLAPVLEANGAYHITVNGQPLYGQRYEKVFGFYEGLAAVFSEKCSFHIDIHGMKRYKKVWKWCGNFQNGFCTVCNELNQYFYISPEGSVVSGPFAYAGDIREGSGVVKVWNGQSDPHGWMHIDPNGNPILSERSFDFLQPYHKGKAIAGNVGAIRSSANGDSPIIRKYHIDRKGAEIQLNGCKFHYMEPFYNGRSLCCDYDNVYWIVEEKNSQSSYNIFKVGQGEE